MSEVTMDEISIQIEGNSDKAIESLTRLTTVLDKLTGATSSSINGLKQTNEKIKTITKTADENNKKTEDSFERVKKALAGYTAKFVTLKKGIFENVESMATYISSVNRFNYTFSGTKEQLEDTKEWVNKLSDAWLLDEQRVADSMSRYYNMTRTMGIVSDSAMRMSKNLTMLTYDLSAFWGDSQSRVTTRIASAMRGEAEGLAEYGISLNQATLQATLYANGINRTVSSLTAAEKAELVYYQIMKSTANQHGYYAKTLLQPANALEILKTQFTKLGRAIGSIFLPMIMAIIPYVIAVTELLTKLAKTIAALFGFELGDWTSDTAEIGAGIGNIGDNAEKAGKKIKGMIADFDELHTIDFGDKSGSSLGLGGGGSLGLDSSQFEYTDSLMDVIDEKLERARKVVAAIKDYIVAIGVALLGYKIGKGVLDFFGTLFDLSDEIKSSFFDIALGFGLIVSGSYLVIDAIFDISQNGLNLWNTLELLIGSLGVFIGTYKILQGLKAAGLYEKLFGTANIVKTALSLSSVIVGLIIFVSAFTVVLDKGSEATGMLALAFSGLGIAMIGVTVLGAPIVAVVVGIAAGIYMLVGYIVELKSRIENLFDPTVEIVDAWDWMADGIKNLGDTVKSATESMGLGFSGAATEASEAFNTINQDTLDTVNNVETYLNQNLAGSLENSQLGFTGYKDYISTVLGQTDTITSEKLKSMQGTITEETKLAKTNAQIHLDAFGREVDTIAGNAESSMKTSMQEMTKDIKNTTSDMDKQTGKWKSMLERGNSANIKAPSFSWKEAINTGLSTALKTTLSMLGLPIMLPAMSISWFADGGFPTKGDLFVANEAGAEWVGSMNGRTAVANQDQITTGVRQAAYEGMRQALAESDFGGTTVYNYLDSKQIASKVTKVRKSNSNMYG